VERVKPLIKRQQAVKATMERFHGKSFVLGSVDCMKMVGFHLKRLGIKVPFAKGGPYKSALSAQAALRRAGHKTVMDVMDSLGLERIAPAAALIGDVVACPADNPLGALAIVVGNGNMLAFHESHEQPVIMTMGMVDTAWRVL
jgi:hypothetical protein